MAIELVPLYEAAVRLDLAGQMAMPDGPLGTRVIVEVREIELWGDRLRARQKGAASADWLTVGPDLTGTLDVRATVETDDGALVFASYRGRMDLSGGPGAAPIYAAPLFETGDDRYRWLNRVQAVAKGILDGDILRYEVYELR